MTGLRGLAWLLARGLALPVSGPVIGMLLLLLALRAPAVRERVAVCADFLLSHLSLLFVPVGVGVMTHLGLVGQYGVRMLIVIVLSTWIGLGVTALALHWSKEREDAQIR